METMTTKDTLFLNEKMGDSPFEFNQSTANVFDDMLNRSVPFYQTIQRLITQTAIQHLSLQKHPTIIDFGCSLGTTLINIGNALDTPSTLIGIDSSPSMIEKAKANSSPQKHKSLKKHTYKWIEQDLNKKVTPLLPKSTLIIMNLTLQFIKKENRLQLLKSIYETLDDDGIFILVEKTIEKDKWMTDYFEKKYYEFKKQSGYSEKEIINKKKALKTVLTPLTKEKNITLLNTAGFALAAPIFQWYNFCVILGKK